MTKSERIDLWVTRIFAGALIAACVVFLGMVLFVTQAIAHNPVASAEQVCEEDGTITLTASFVNEGFEGETTVTATDSGGLVLPAGTSPYTGSANTPGPDRAAGTVTFNWSADNGHNGTVDADYGAVADCEAPPPPTPPDNPPDEEQPPQDISVPGGPHSGPGDTPDQPAAQPAERDTLPFSGPPPAGILLAVGAALLGAGLVVRRAA